MHATLPVRALVSRRELSITKDGVRLRLGCKRELLVDLAAVDEQWGDGILRVFLHVPLVRSKTVNREDSGIQ